jgi:nucleotidyltransferase/DNA polymerase involved in DNA repair
MRVACALVPVFAVAVERQADPRLNDQPLAVISRGRILDACATLGLRAGVPVREARALYPHATFLEANVQLYRKTFDCMLEALESVTPFVEAGEPGCAYADITGLERHYNDEFALAASFAERVRQSIGLLPAIGIASGKFVAQAAASNVTEGDAGIVPAGSERAFLRDKPASLLPYAADTLVRLERLALRTLGDIGALPQTAVEAQFRRAGTRLWELANGIDHEPVHPRKHQEVLSERLTYESPVVATEALLMGSRQLLGRLVRRLGGRTAARVHVQLLSDERIAWERTDTLREPTGDERRIALLVKARLSMVALTQAVQTITVTLSGISQEVGKQTKLFTSTAQNVNQIGEAIRQLRTRYGRPVVYRVLEVDPRSRHPEERAALVPYDA